MLSEAILKNQAGWTVEAMAKFLAFERVVRIDARGLMSNNRFSEMVVLFQTADDAAAFLSAAASNLPR